MKWEGNRESDNVEDRRSGGGGGSGLFGGRSIGIRSEERRVGKEC